MCLVSQKGFTLAEVAFSIAIIGMAVVVSMAVFASGIRAQNVTSQRMVAAATVTYLMDVGLGRDLGFVPAIPPIPPRPTLPLLQNLASGGYLVSFSGANNWANVPITIGDFLLENPLGGADIAATNQFVLSSPDFGNPAAALIFAESTCASAVTGVRWRKLSVWGCDWRNKPSGVTMRAPLLTEFMYYDYPASTH